MAPGTVTERASLSGMALSPAPRSAAAERPEGARPEALRPITSSPSLWISANMSPPMPVIAGSPMPQTRAAAMAASTALPPPSRISTAVLLAMGCEVAAMPFAP